MLFSTFDVQYTFKAYFYNAIHLFVTLVFQI